MQSSELMFQQRLTPLPRFISTVPSRISESCNNLSLILLHGSQVTGKTHAKSDTDIAVMQNGNAKDLDILGLYGDLTNLFKNDRIDITNITHANPLLAFAVARRSKLLSGSKEDYDSFVRTAFFKYNDYKPYLKMEQDFVKEKIYSYAKG